MKNLSIGVLLLVMCTGTFTGCGCGDSFTDVLPASETASFRIRSAQKPCEIPFTPVEEKCEVKIDVFFVIDDSNFMYAPVVAGDPRTKMEMTKRIFLDIRKRLQTQLDTAAQNGNLAAVCAQYGLSNLPADVVAKLAAGDVRFDIAFGVGRYEDYGNSTVNFDLNGNLPPAAQAGVIDANARPFILNMPILREHYLEAHDGDAANPNFDPIFESALDVTGGATPDAVGPISTENRRAFGDGSVGFASAAQFRQDPQSGFEALYQVATGAGFDGNADADNEDSGLPCGNLAQGLAPAVLNPGETNDVPSVGYQPLPNEPQQPGEPVREVFLVGDGNGNFPQGGADAPGACITSGNEGGVGWRNGSARFVLLASDVAAISAIDPEPAFNATLSVPNNTPLPCALPGPFAGSVLASAFDGTTGRFGADAGKAGIVAPAGAATPQQAVNALEGACIEALFIGAPGILPGPVKPNATTTPIFGIPVPSSPSFLPYTWMSGVSKLTGVRNVVTAAEDAANAGDWPNVFDMATVIPHAQPGPSDDMLNGLYERVAVHMCENPAAVVCPISDTLPPNSPDIEVCFELIVNGSTPGFTASFPFVGTQLRATALVPTYYRDTITNDAFQVIGGNRIDVGQPGAIASTNEDTVIAFFDPASTITEAVFQYASENIPPDQLATTSFTLERVSYTLPGGLPQEHASILDECMLAQDVEVAADIDLIGNANLVDPVVATPSININGNPGGSCVELLEPNFTPYQIGNCDPLGGSFPLGLFSKAIDSSFKPVAVP